MLKIMFQFTANKEELSLVLRYVFDNEIKEFFVDILEVERIPTGKIVPVTYMLQAKSDLAACLHFSACSSSSDVHVSCNMQGIGTLFTHVACIMHACTCTMPFNKHA